MAVARAYSSDLVCKKLSLFTTKGATNSLPEDLCSQKPYRFDHRTQARDPLRLTPVEKGGSWWEGSLGKCARPLSPFESLANLFDISSFLACRDYCTLLKCRALLRRVTRPEEEWWHYCAGGRSNRGPATPSLASNVCSLRRSYSGSPVCAAINWQSAFIAWLCSASGIPGSMCRPNEFGRSIRVQRTMLDALDSS